MAITVSCNSTPGGVVGTPYSHFFTSDNPDAIIYIFPGVLNSGLTLDNTTGEVSGTPDTISWTPAELAAGSEHESLTVTAFNPNTLESATIICGLGTFLNCLPLTPDCASPPGGAIAVPYSHSLMVASGGIAPFSFVITSGALPTGLTMDASGNITGTPTTNGLFFFEVTVTGSGDPLNNTAVFTCSISIGGAQPGDSPQLYFFAFGFLGPLAIGCGDPPDGNLGTAYFHLFPILPSGSEPYVFDISAGALPDGLTLDPATGIVSGTPTLVGVFNFTIRVTDDAAQTATADCSITITLEALSISGAPPAGEVGTPYSFTPDVTGGTPPYSFTIDNLCTEFGVFTFNPATGELSGTPIAPGTCCFTITVTDDNDNQAELSVCATFRGCILGGF